MSRSRTNFREVRYKNLISSNTQTGANANADKNANLKTNGKCNAKRAGPQDTPRKTRAPDFRIDGKVEKFPELRSPSPPQGPPGENRRLRSVRHNLLHRPM